MELKYIIARNIKKLRSACGMTQLQLAESLNYSDKAISKWESGASLPDIVVLKEIADLFGVTVDSLLTEGGTPEKITPQRSRTHLIITLLSVMLVWLIATTVFVFLGIAGYAAYAWLAFIWALPVSSIVVLIFNSIWGKRRMNYLIISVLMWTFLTAVYLSALRYNMWLLFVLGIPGETIIYLWSAINKKRKKY